MINSNENIPEPEETGTAGTQIESTDLDVEVPKQPLEGFYLPKAIEGLAAVKSRSIGGEVVSKLISATTRQMAHDQTELKKELSALREKYDASREEISSLRVDKASLEAELIAEKKNRNLRNSVITIGTLFVGAGIQMFLDDDIKITYPVVFTILGLIVALVGWLSGTKGESQ